jgi:hypothetical protein
MRLTRAVLAVDDTEFYHEIAQIAVDGWRTKIDLIPVVGFIGRHDPPKLDGAEIVLIPPLTDLPTAFQAQGLRLLLPALFPDDVLISSDADMVPLSAQYFHNGVSSARENDFVIYRPFERIREGADNDLHLTQVPICYNAARGSVWSEIFGVTDVTGIRRRLSEWFERFRDDPEQLWSADQRLLHEHLALWDPEARRTVRLGDDVTGHRRLHVGDVSAAARRRRERLVLPRSVLRATDLHIESTVQRHPESTAALLDCLGLSRTGGNQANPREAPVPVTVELSGSSYSSHIAPLATAVLNTQGAQSSNWVPVTAAPGSYTRSARRWVATYLLPTPARLGSAVMPTSRPTGIASNTYPSTRTTRV